MSTLIAAESGVWSAAGTWHLVSPESISDSEAAQTYVPDTTPTYSSNFTPGAIEVDGIAIKVQSCVGATGTITVMLRNTTDNENVTGATCTVNVADLPAFLAAVASPGWVFFKFVAPVTLEAAHTYAVGVSTSTASMVYVWVTATTNWSRFLRTTTNQAPAADDQFVIVNELTGAGTSNAVTVTMDDVSGTSYGAVVATYLQSISIACGGTLVCGVVAATAYTLKWKGILKIWPTGTLTEGTVAAPMPSNSSLTMTHNSTANVDTGVVCDSGATWTRQGRFKASTQVKMTASIGGMCTSVLATRVVTRIEGEPFTNYAPGQTVTINAVAKVIDVISDADSMTITVGATNATPVVYTNVTGALATTLVTTERAAGTCTSVSSTKIVTRVTGPPFTGLTGHFYVNQVELHVASVESADSLTLSDDPGDHAVAVTWNAAMYDWQVGDLLGVASSTRTPGDCEQATIASITDMTTVVVSAALAKYHSGVNSGADIRAEVINLTRNIVHIGASATLQGYISIGATSTLDWDYAEHKWLGSATAGKLGVNIATTTGQVNIQYCSLHDFIVTESLGFYLTGTSGQTISTLVISNNVAYGINASLFYNVATTGTWTVTCNVFMKNVAGISGIVCLGDVGGVFSNNVICGEWSDNSTRACLVIWDSGLIGTMSDNVCHSGGGNGVFAVGLRGTINNQTSYRNGLHGLYFYDSYARTRRLIVSNPILHGNPDNLGVSSRTLVTNILAAGNRAFSSSTGIYWNVPASGFVLEGGSLGTVSGILTGHTQDILPVANQPSAIMCRNVDFNSTVMVPQATLATALPGSYILSQRHGAVAGDHRCWLVNGLVQTDSVISRTAAPSLRMTPSVAGAKLETAPDDSARPFGFRARAASGDTITASVWVRKSAAGDASGRDYPAGADYLPHLVVRKNVAAGIAADTVLDTMDIATPVGTWEQLSGTTAAVTDDAELEFIVDCMVNAVVDPIAWLNVDDFATAVAVDSKGLKYWRDGVPSVSGDNTTGGGSGGGMPVLGGSVVR